MTRSRRHGLSAPGAVPLAGTRAAAMVPSGNKAVPVPAIHEDRLGRLLRPGPEE